MMGDEEPAAPETVKKVSTKSLKKEAKLQAKVEEKAELISQRLY